MSQINISYWQIISSLSMVLLIMVPFFYILRKFNLKGFSGKGIKVLERIVLGNGVQLVIAEILGTYYLLSISPSQVALLKEIKSPEELSLLKDLYNVEVNFNRLLDGVSLSEKTGILNENRVADKDFHLKNHALKKHLNTLDKLLLRK